MAIFLNAGASFTFTFIIGLFVMYVAFYGIIYEQKKHEYYMMLKAEKKKKKEDALFEQEMQKRREMHNAQTYVRIYNFITENPNKANEIIQNIANEMKHKIAIQSKDKFVLEPMQSSVQSILVDNDERLELAKQDLEKVNNYNPNTFLTLDKGVQPKLFKDLLDEYHNLFLYEKQEGVPLNPMIDILKANGIYMNYFLDIKQKILLLEKEYSEAIPYLEKEVAIMSSGIGGENRVNKELKMYDNIWKVYPNARIEVDGESAESDFIVLSKKGIFIIEVKNYSAKGNYSVHITKDGQWLKVFDNGKSEPISDITSQMNRHIALKQRLLMKSINNPNIPLSFKPIIVFANDTIRINNETDLPIMRISKIYHHIMNQPDILNDDEIDEIAKVLEANLLAPKKYEYQDYSNLFSNSEIIKKQVLLMQFYVDFAYEYFNRAKKELLHELAKR